MRDFIICGSTKTVQHSTKNISRNIRAGVFKLGTRNLHQKKQNGTCCAVAITSCPVLIKTKSPRFLTARPWAERGSWFTRGFFNRAAMGRRGSCFTRGFFFFVVLSVTRPKLLSATLRMTQLMVFIRVKNILQIYEYYTLYSIKKSSLQQGGTMG